MLAPQKDQSLTSYALDLAEREWGEEMPVFDIRKQIAQTTDPHAPWFISVSEPRRETVAEESLKEDDFEVFYPVRHVTVTPPRWKVSLKMRDKRHLLAKTKDEPVFRGYLFIRPGPSNPGLRRIFTLRGVVGLVHFGEMLAQVSNDLVESLRSGQARKALEEHFASTPFPFKVGDKGVLTAGALAEHTARIERVDESSGTIHALVKLFGRECRVATNIEQFEKIG